MLGKFGEISKMTHPTRRRFLGMIIGSLNRTHFFGNGVPQIGNKEHIGQDIKISLNPERIKSLVDNLEYSSDDVNPLERYKRTIGNLRLIYPDLKPIDDALSIGESFTHQLAPNLAMLQFNRMKGLLLQESSTIQALLGLINSGEIQINIGDVVMDSFLTDSVLGDLDVIAQDGGFEILGNIIKGEHSFDVQIFLSNNDFIFDLRDGDIFYCIEGKIGKIDEILDFLKLPDSDFLQKVQSQKFIRKNHNYTNQHLDFLNTTALTSIAHIKNRVYDLTQDAPQDFPLSFAVQDVLGKTELDMKVLINNIHHF